MEIKDKLLNFIKIYKIKIIIIISTLITFTSLLLTITLYIQKDETHEEIVLNDFIEDIEIKQEEIIDYVIVDIKGYVVNPGIYKLEPGSRVNDVIDLAGGLVSGANTKDINLSKKVFDEMVIIIYSENEIEEFNNSNQKECICESDINDACTEESKMISNDISQYLSENKTISLININTASIEELSSLDGIGESKAKAIIEYRNEFGKFSNIEDLMEVSGIGESVYNKIKDLIITE